MSFTNIAQVNTEHTEWIKGLEFYKEEIHILETALRAIDIRDAIVTAGFGASPTSMATRTASTRDAKMRAIATATIRPATSVTGKQTTATIVTMGGRMPTSFTIARRSLAATPKPTG
jgi:hypothetical protein